ncbi:MAG TPA: D-glycerate dehydrogenase [Corynebacteriales bacterium]|jgi:glyoxylate reductase|nr:D-glycerate dehydrogenase [Mycobacteriales bacterium]
MLKKKVLVTRKLPDEAMRLLYETCEVELNPYDRAMTEDEIIEGLNDKQGLLCLLTDTINAQIMDAAKNLKVISNYAVGFDNIDVKAATERRILVTNTPGVLTETTADLTWALLMAAARRIVEADGFMRRGEYKGWGPMLFLGGDVFGKTLGLIGMGRIGSAVARRAAGFNMRVLYYDMNRLSEDEEKAFGVEYAEFDEVLKESDFVSLHVPLLSSTWHLIGERELSLMKLTSYLINTSRGPVVDEKALVEALRSCRIAGAGLDVYENEPEMAPGLHELENVVLLPHIASASVDTRTKMGTMAAHNLIAGLVGELPKNCVNPEVFSKAEHS